MYNTCRDYFCSIINGNVPKVNLVLLLEKTLVLYDVAWKVRNLMAEFYQLEKKTQILGLVFNATGSLRCLQNKSFNLYWLLFQFNNYHLESSLRASSIYRSSSLRTMKNSARRYNYIIRWLPQRPDEYGRAWDSVVEPCSNIAARDI